MYKYYIDKFIVPEKHYEIWDMQHSVLEPVLGVKEFYKQIRKIYLKTIFNPFRTASLKLNTAPPVFSSKYIRLISGCIKIYFDLKKAYKHSNILSKIY